MTPYVEWMLLLVALSLIVQTAFVADLVSSVRALEHNLKYLHNKESQ